jgi:hypothetical protein
MVALAASNQGSDAFAKCVVAATEGEFVSSKLLTMALESAKYEIRTTPRKVLTRVEVFKDDNRIAYGESGGATDALLQAALGYLREPPPVEQKESGEQEAAA